VRVSVCAYLYICMGVRGTSSKMSESASMTCVLMRCVAVRTVSFVASSYLAEARIICQGTWAQFQVCASHTSLTQHITNTSTNAHLLVEVRSVVFEHCQEVLLLARHLPLPAKGAAVSEAGDIIQLSMIRIVRIASATL
jgi:hypothetical protein